MELLSILWLSIFIIIIFLLRMLHNVNWNKRYKFYRNVGDIKMALVLIKSTTIDSRKNNLKMLKVYFYQHAFNVT